MCLWSLRVARMSNGWILDVRTYGTPVLYTEAKKSTSLSSSWHFTRKEEYMYIHTASILKRIHTHARGDSSTGRHCEISSALRFFLSGHRSPPRAQLLILFVVREGNHRGSFVGGTINQDRVMAFPGPSLYCTVSFIGANQEKVNMFFWLHVAPRSSCRPAHSDKRFRLSKNVCLFVSPASEISRRSFGRGRHKFHAAVRKVTHTLARCQQHKHPKVRLEEALKSQGPR